jgi:hypothetical protein
MAAIVNLRTKLERLREDQVEIMRQAVLPFVEHDTLAPLARALIVQIAQQTASRSRWTFVMLSPAQNAAVVNYLAGHSRYPIVAMRIWALCFEHLDHETGEIMLRRDQVAEAIGEQPAHVSTIMSELVEFGAISRRREKMGGMRGPGLVRYFMNPKVATHLAGKERDDAQADAPLLRLIETATPPPAKAKDVVVSIRRPKAKPRPQHDDPAV